MSDEMIPLIALRTPEDRALVGHALISYMAMMCTDVIEGTARIGDVVEPIYRSGNLLQAIGEQANHEYIERHYGIPDDPSGI